MQTEKEATAIFYTYTCSTQDPVVDKTTVFVLGQLNKAEHCVA